MTKQNRTKSTNERLVTLCIMIGVSLLVLMLAVWLGLGTLQHNTLKLVAFAEFLLLPLSSVATYKFASAFAAGRMKTFDELASKTLDFAHRVTDVKSNSVRSARQATAASVIDQAPLLPTSTSTLKILGGSFSEDEIIDL